MPTETIYKFDIIRVFRTKSAYIRVDCKIIDKWINRSSNKLWHASYKFIWWPKSIGNCNSGIRPWKKWVKLTGARFRKWHLPVCEIVSNHQRGLFSTSPNSRFVIMTQPVVPQRECCLILEDKKHGDATAHQHLKWKLIHAWFDYRMLLWKNVYYQSFNIFFKCKKYTSLSCFFIAGIVYKKVHRFYKLSRSFHQSLSIIFCFFYHIDNCSFFISFNRKWSFVNFT